MDKLTLMTKSVLILLLLMAFGVGNVWGEDETTYSINTSSIDNGSIKITYEKGPEITSAVTGTTVTITVTSDYGYALGDLYYMYESTTTYLYRNTTTSSTVTSGSYSFVMPASNVTVSATFKPLYNITKANNITNGSISFTDAAGASITSAISGTTVYVTVEPSSGYALSTMNYTYTEHEANTIEYKDGKYSFTMPEATVTVNATFAQLHKITASSDDNGTVSFTDENGTGITEAISGAKVNVVATPNVYYELSTLTFGETDIKSSKSFTMPDNDVTITATFTEVPNDRLIFYTTSNNQALGLTTMKTLGMWGTDYEGNFGGGQVVQLVSDVYDSSNEKGVLTFDRSVLSIGTQSGSDSPFSNNTCLTSLKMPSTVTLIGGHAFDGCTQLIKIGTHSSDNDLSNVLYFTDYALNGCSSLETHKFTENISYIGIDAFNGCSSMKNDFVFAHDGLEIQGYSFLGSGITSVTFKGKNIQVDIEAFGSCKSLGSVKTDGGSITSIAENAFKNSSTTEVDLTMTSSIGKDAFMNDSTLTSVKIDGCTVIGENAFNTCKRLSNVLIKGNSCAIKDNAFYGLDSLQTVDIDGCMSIGKYSFELCKKLSNVTLKGCTEIQEGAFSMNPKITSIVIPSSCVTIGHSAFYGTGLTSLTLNEGLETIGEQAFASGLHIDNLVIPASVKEIGENAFNSCTDIKTVVFKISQDTEIKKNIGNAAFSSCTSLKYVILPKAISSLGYNVFNGCNSLEKLFFISTSSPDLGTMEETSLQSQITTLYTPFSGMSKNPDIYVPVGSKESYKQAFEKAGVIKSTTNGETGDVKSNKVLGWDLFTTNSSGWGTYGGTCSEGGEGLVEHNWDFQSYKYLLENIKELGVSDINELNLYYPDEWNETTDSNDKKTKTVYFKKMNVTNTTEDGTTTQSTLLLRKGDGLLYGNDYAINKKYAILEAADETGTSYTKGKNLMKAGANVAPRRKNGEPGFYYAYTSKTIDSKEQRGFYRLSSNVVFPAGKAYLDLTDLFYGSDVKSNIVFDGFDDDATGIIELFDDTVTVGHNSYQSGIMYNLSGQQVSEPHGVYIKNGKKYFAK